MGKLSIVRAAVVLTAVVQSTALVYGQSATAPGLANPVGGAPPGVPTTQTGSEPNAPVEEVIVEGVPIEQSVLPTARPISSVFGTDMNILDTPRNATIFNQNELRERDIQSIEQISRIVPSAYSPSRWGTASVPQFRGDQGQIYINGIRTAFNENGIPVNFNPVESLDAVPGPASVVFGPGAQVGGYVNLVTKAPYFDKFQGSLQLSVGTFDKYNWQLDVGGPIIPNKLAYRISYEGQEAGDYYQNVRHNFQSIFTAVSWTPNSKFKLDFDGSFYAITAAEVGGINRPTQDLIDNGNYITGSTTDSGFGFPTTTPGFLGLVTATGTKKINLNRVISAPSDGEYGKNWYLQLAATYEFSEDFKVTNREYFESMDRKKHSAYYYLEYVPEQYVYENRTEFNWHFDVPYGSGGGAAKPTDAKDGKDSSKDGKAMAAAMPQKSIGNDVSFGLDYRMERTRGYVEFQNEDYNAFDLTLDSNTYHVPTSTLFGALPLSVNGRPEFGDTGGNYPATGLPNNNNTADSWFHDVGLFLQDNIKVTDWLSFIIGGRGDLVYIESEDPLPPPGYKADEDSLLAGRGAAEASINIKPTKNDTIYLSYAYVQASEGSYLDGAYGLRGSSPNGGAGLTPTSVHKESQLYEIGNKASLFKDTLFLSVAAFYQKRTTPTRSNAPIEVDAHGIEGSAVYQPNKNFSASLSGGWLNAYYNNYPPGQVATVNVFDTFNPPVGTGVGSPNFGSYNVGDYRVPELPNFTVNGYARYALDMGLGVSGGVSVTGPQHLDVLGNTRIPAQYTLNAAVFYNWKWLETRVDFFNITNEVNWSGIDPTYGQDLVVRELPFHVLGTVKIKF